MVGKKDSPEQIFHYFYMQDLVPDDHILKLIDKHVDFSFVRERVRALYSHTGRPSVDPEVMIRMLLVGYLFGITSERRLCEEVKMHVGYRWFLGLNMEDKVPDHSTFSKNRHGRFAGSGLWEDIFDEIVRRCMDAGLVKAEHVTADGTLMDADASVKSMESIVVEMNPKKYLETLKQERKSSGGAEENGEGDGGGGEFCGKGTKISNKTHRSATDPDARLARKKKNSDTKLRYQVGYVMDNASRVILDASVGGECGRGAEMEQARTGLERVKWRYRLRPRTLGADKGYAVGQFIRDVYESGIVPHVPVWDTRREHDKGIYTIEQFAYNEENDCFICPRGNVLKYHGRNHKQVIYRAKAKDCKRCDVKKECTRAAARSVSFHVHKEYIDKAGNEMKKRSYKLSQRNRKKIESLFGEAKEQMGMRRMKFRGRATVKEQILLTAVAQNIKRLVKFLERHAPKPAQAARAAHARPQNTAMARVFHTIQGFFSIITAIFCISFLFGVNSAPAES